MSDIRDRILNALVKGFSSREDLHNEVRGGRDFFLKVCESWSILKEFTRLITIGGNDSSEIILKFESGKHKNLDDFKEEERDLAGFDCYSLY